MSFGGTIKLEGATEYQQALNKITSNLKVMSSEMNVVTSSFSKNNATAKNLTDVNTQLNKKLEQQKEAVKNLEQILELTKSKYGDNSTQAQKMTIELNNAKSAVNKTETAIKNNNTTLDEMKKAGAENTQELSKFSKEADNAKEHSKNFADVLSANLLSGAITDGLKSIANGIKDISSKMIDAVKDTAAYGDNIDKASQKAGLSAQAYQEWDYVMQRNGTSMDSCSNGLKTLNNKFDDALNGSSTATAAFAKLGYSVDDLKGKSREDIFALTVQGLQGISDESEKAALANDLLGKSGMEMLPMLNQSSESTQELIQNYRDLGGVMSDEAVAASAAFEDNLTDIQAGMQGIVRDGIGQLLPFVNTGMQGVIAIIKGNGDEGTQMIADAITGIGGMITENMPAIVQSATGIITSIMTTLDANMPMILESATTIVSTLCSGIAQNLPMIVNGAMQLITTLVTGLIQNLPMLLQSAIEIIVQFAGSLSESLPTLIPVMVDAVLQMATTLIDNIDLLVDAAIELILALANGLIEALPQLIEQAPVIISALVSAILRNMPMLVQAAIQLIVALAGGLIQALPQLVSAAPRLISGLASALGQGFSSMASVGLHLVQGIWNGISNATGWILEKIKGFGSSVVKGIKGIFGIHSPSRVMRDEVGKYLALGIGEGFTDQIDAVNDQMHSAVDLDFGTAQIKTGTTGTAGIAGGVDLVAAFREAMQGMQIILDDEKAGEFVTRTVTRQVFAR